MKTHMNCMTVSMRVYCLTDEQPKSPHCLLFKKLMMRWKHDEVEAKSDHEATRWLDHPKAEAQEENLMKIMKMHR